MQLTDPIEFSSIIQQLVFVPEKRRSENVKKADDIFHSLSIFLQRVFLRKNKMPVNELAVKAFFLVIRAKAPLLKDK